jgi:MraZ protein
MSFFKGREIYSVDAKGRVNIPAKMRKSMSPDANDTFVVTRGPDDEPCIYAYPLDEWRKFEENLKGLNQFNEQDRFFVRTLLYWADEVTFDGQFRIMIPKALHDFTRIEKNALILGAMDHIEIWNPEVFETYMSARTESYANVAASVMGMKKI